jgi:hypothetical protein
MAGPDRQLLAPEHERLAAAVERLGDRSGRAKHRLRLGPLVADDKQNPASIIGDRVDEGELARFESSDAGTFAQLLHAVRVRPRSG